MRSGEPLTRTRVVLFRVVVPLLAIAFVLGLFEIALRLVGFDPLGRALEGRDYFLRASTRPGLDYELVPGIRGHAWGADIAINSHGFRDRDYPVEKPRGVRRIAVIGDSIAFGNHMAASDTFPEQLEALFAQRGRPVEVLNLAVPGYDTQNEVAFLEQTGLAFQPDLVVVGYCINDLGTQSVNIAVIRILERYGFLTRHSRVAQWLTARADAVKALVDREFAAGETEEEFIRANRGRIAPVRGDAEVQARIAHLDALRRRSSYPFLPWYLSEARLGKLRFAFEHLQLLARTNQFRVAVLLIPFLDDEGQPDAYQTAFDLVRHEAERVGFTAVDPTDEFRSRGLAPLMQKLGGRPDVLHPNAEGHAILARSLYAEIDALLPMEPEAHP
jgi:lysophospholipase L1-like esterase